MRLIKKTQFLEKQDKQNLWTVRLNKNEENCRERRACNQLKLTKVSEKKDFKYLDTAYIGNGCCDG